MLNALRYFPWYFRDSMLTRGGAIAAIALLLLLPLLLMDISPTQMERGLGLLLSESIGGMSVFLTLVATYGIVGDDARRGYFRNVFSKPVSPEVYYLLAFVALILVYVLVLLLAIGVFAVRREPVWPGQAFMRALLVFYLLGSTVFGLSRLTRFDWLFGALLFVFGQVTRQAYPPGASLRGTVLNLVLPPSHRLQNGVFGPEGVIVGDVAWLLGYGAVFLVMGLVSVRLLAFGTQRS